MWDILGGLQDLLRIDHISIDNPLFKLHYKFTTFILVVFSVSITVKQQFGDPIDCLPDDVGNICGGKKSDDYYKTIDAYCWVSSTYTVTELINGKVGVSVIAPGVGQLTNHETTKLHKYYQWVGLFLFIQAMLFYAPHFLWLVWEAGRMQMLSKELMSSVLDEDNQALQRKNLKFYFMGHLGYNNLYFFRFIFCEILNFVNVIGQIILTDIFMGYEFTTYGTQVLSFNKEDGRAHPMDRVFPKITKCVFNLYGPSGNIVPHDIICLLPLNRMNENIYIFLWFWFIIVACLSALGLIFRVLVIVFAPFRALLLARRTVFTMNDYGCLKFIVSECHLGDWFVLHQMGKNIDKVAFNEFMKDLARGLEERADLRDEEKLNWLENMNVPRLSIASTKQFPPSGKMNGLFS